MGEINNPSVRSGDAENARINQSSALVIYNATSFPNSQNIIQNIHHINLNQILYNVNIQLYQIMLHI